MHAPIATLTSPGAGTVLDEYARLDKIIRDGETSLTIAQRLKSMGRWQSEWDSDLEDLQKRIDQVRKERDWLEGAVSRRSALCQSA